MSQPARAAAPPASRLILIGEEQRREPPDHAADLHRTSRHIQRLSHACTLREYALLAY
jgi:hypothetical protein